MAGLYNQLFRRGMKSQYSAENVCIAGGGRVAVMRACAAIAPIHLGHFLPDYTAYEELLDVFRRFLPIPILLDPKHAYEFTREELEEEILGRGLSAILASNPCNPTGKVVQGDALASWVETARDLNCALLLDEFYSHYVWTETNRSSARRSTSKTSTGSDRRVRRAHEELAVPRLPRELDRRPEAGHRVGRERGLVPRWRRGRADAARRDRPRAGRADARRDEAVHDEFKKKRDFLVEGLKDIGVKFDLEPQGTFYAWGDLSGLPPRFATATTSSRPLSSGR